MRDGAFSIFLGGDAMISEPWSQVEDPAFAGLLAEMRRADATVINLETAIHEFLGFAQPESGGTYTAAPPAVAAELKWAGIDMVATANNHAFDYGTSGVIETLRHLQRAGVLHAGTGADLDAARTPALLEKDGGTVALVSMAATFVPWGLASNARPDMPGRPGLNPLRLTKRMAATITPALANRLFPRRGAPWTRGETVRRFGLRFLVGERSTLDFFSRSVFPPDRAANLAAIAKASARADVTIASIHAHAPRRWLRRLARSAIDRGADIVFVQGPHEVRAIEFHAGRPIFHGLGDFVYQPHRLTRFPAEAYEGVGLAATATLAELHAAWTRQADWPGSNRKAFESVCAILDFRGRALERVRLLPLDLQFGAAPERLGRPRLADRELGRRIIAEVAELSRKHGTIVRYDAASNQGWLEMPR